MSDPGIALLDHIYTVMNIDAEWSVREERALTWWGKDFAQRIWAEPPFDEDGFRLSRLHARTDLLRAFTPSERNLVILGLLNAIVSLSGFLWDPEEPDRVRLAASFCVHDQNLEMVRRLFSFAVAVQAADAQIKAPLLARVMGAECDASPHPVSGFRPQCDDMLNVIEDLVAPMGECKSLWIGEEMKEMVSFLQKPPCVLCTGDGNGLAAEFPLFEGTMLLTMETHEKHPQLGNGLLVRLSLPFGGSIRECARWAARLNVLELRPHARAPFLGSWCSNIDGIHYVAFYPNSIYIPGLLQNLVLHMGRRARWVAENVFGDDWSRSYGAAIEFKLKALPILSALAQERRKRSQKVN